MKDVIITIKGDQLFNGDGTDIEFMTDGKYLATPEKVLFNYMESELTGMEGTITTVEVRDGIATISREGSVEMVMTFEEGKKNYFLYGTSFGTMSIGVETSSIYSTLGEHGGELEINYLLNMENTQLSRNKFRISIKEA